MLTLCATHRLARFVRRAARRPDRVIPAPAATTPGQWLFEQGEALALSGADLPACLSPEAERLLWEQAITQDLGRDAADLFDIAGLAQTAQAAQALIALWGAPPPPDGTPAGVETQRFLRWQRQFDRLRGPRIDPGRWQRAVLQRLDACPLPTAVRWRGFDRLTPLENDLIEALRARGVAVEVEPLQGAPTTPQLCGHASAGAECAAIAAWAQGHLQRRPDARLGIVVLDLAASAPALRRALEAAVPGRYNLSLGAPLAQTGPVRAALESLQLLTLPSQSIPKLRLSRHLTSPYHPGDPDTRALQDAVLREQAGETAATPFEAKPPRALLPSAWRDWIRQWLPETGWPGTRGLDSFEHQAVAAFADLLQRLGALDAVSGPMPLSRAVSLLQRLAREQPFQAQTVGERPIEVLGLLESTGLAFDALWISGLSAETWPPPPRPNPLLPHDWQRQQAMPHASPEVERDFALRVQARLLRAAPEVVFSWVCEDRSIAASPLIPVDASFPTAPARDWAPAALESLSDHIAPPLAEASRVHGGASLFKAQALCPAWAFYQFRTRATPLPEPQPVLNALRRGNLMHRALELFWQQTRDHAGLLALSAGQRAARIGDCARRALTETLPQLTGIRRDLELDRSVRGLTAWLDFEAGQEDFAIDALELECRDLPVGPLTLARLKIDRIDRLADGSLRVIDYKTSKAAPSLKGWETEPLSKPLSEPQIPLYTLAAADRGLISAAAFGHLSSDKPRLIGKSGEAFAALRQPWPAQLVALAQGFAAGDAAVRYAHPKALAHCEVLPLLRLAETDLEADDDEVA